MWAAQLVGLKKMAGKPINNYLVNTTVPEGIDVKALMTYNSGTDPASDEFYRQEKLGMLNHIAGEDITEEVIWCSGDGCSLSFPVNMPCWTARSLIALGI